jgi:hypothetical protein
VSPIVWERTEYSHVWNESDVIVRRFEELDGSSTFRYSLVWRLLEVPLIFFFSLVVVKERVGTMVWCERLV